VSAARAPGGAGALPTISVVIPTCDRPVLLARAIASVRAQTAPAGGVVTHVVMLRVDDARESCDRAVAAGAALADPVTDHVYGERQCSLVDPWGHRWTLSQTLADVAPEEWGGIGGWGD